RGIAKPSVGLTLCSQDARKKAVRTQMENGRRRPGALGEKGVRRGRALMKLLAHLVEKPRKVTCGAVWHSQACGCREAEPRSQCVTGRSPVTSLHPPRRHPVRPTLFESVPAD